MTIDLHAHTTASDGTLSPRELVALAKKTGLKAVAVTDHDTVSGLAEALEAGRELGQEVIPGCELSVGEGRQSMHIVGLWLTPEAPKLREALEFVIRERGNRNHKIIAKLNELGLDITYEEVAERAGGTVGRPHMAQALMARGLVSSVNEAFEKYIGNSGAAYVPRTRLSPAQALEVLRAEGATPILAHPYLLQLPLSQLEVRLRELMDLGLEGMEVYYTEHSNDIRRAYRALADRLGLLVSGGSDFHGSVKPGIHLGRGKGDLYVDDNLLEAMKAHRRERGQWV
ncbi:PHP domain-containing protein [Paucidesulfovibrio longus]|uniref:PHP domain-containing protein n=1 Tax=Paucidesulfovibrio longus TaxID=889 RepID=UPI0003B7AA7F|nr:PHP domain-containing protein [Paucidesulfovibrio longus]